MKKRNKEAIQVIDLTVCGGGPLLAWLEDQVEEEISMLMWSVGLWLLEPDMRDFVVDHWEFECRFANQALELLHGSKAEARSDDSDDPKPEGG